MPLVVKAEIKMDLLQVALSLTLLSCPGWWETWKPGWISLGLSTRAIYSCGGHGGRRVHKAYSSTEVTLGDRVLDRNSSSLAWVSLKKQKAPRCSGNAREVGWERISLFEQN